MEKYMVLVWMSEFGKENNYFGKFEALLMRILLERIEPKLSKQFNFPSI